MGVKSRMKLFVFLIVILAVSLVACDPSPQYPGHIVCDEYNGTHHKVSKSMYVCVLENETPRSYIIEYNGTILKYPCRNVENGLQYAATRC